MTHPGRLEKPLYVSLFNISQMRKAQLDKPAPMIQSMESQHRWKGKKKSPTGEQAPVGDNPFIRPGCLFFFSVNQ